MSRQPKGKWVERKTFRRSRSVSEPVLLLALAVALLMPGCATIAQILDTEAPAFRGDPEQTVLLVVDCEIDLQLGQRNLLESLLLGGSATSDPADVVGGVISGSGDVKHEGTVQRGLLVFEGLPPDTYVLRLVQAEYRLDETESRELYECPGTWWKECPDLIEVEYLIHTDDQRRLTRELSAGEFIVISRLTFEEDHSPPFDRLNPSWKSDGTVFDNHRHHNPRDVLTIVESPVLEAEILERLVSDRAPNAWTERMQARLAELRATG